MMQTADFKHMRDSRNVATQDTDHSNDILVDAIDTNTMRRLDFIGAEPRLVANNLLYTFDSPMRPAVHKMDHLVDYLQHGNPLPRTVIQQPKKIDNKAELLELLNTRKQNKVLNGMTEITDNKEYTAFIYQFRFHLLGLELTPGELKYVISRVDLSNLQLKYKSLSWEISPLFRFDDGIMRYICKSGEYYYFSGSTLSYISDKDSDNHITFIPCKDDPNTILYIVSTYPFGLYYTIEAGQVFDDFTYVPYYKKHNYEFYQLVKLNRPTTIKRKIRNTFNKVRTTFKNTINNTFKSNKKQTIFDRLKQDNPIRYDIKSPICQVYLGNLTAEYVPHETANENNSVAHITEYTYEQKTPVEEVKGPHRSITILFQISDIISKHDNIFSDKINDIKKKWLYNRLADKISRYSLDDVNVIQLITPFL